MKNDSNPYTIDQRLYAFTPPLESALALNPQKNYLFPLPYLNSIRIEGENALNFLQGQLTCDLREVTQNQMRQGALCNLQGRVLALCDLIFWDNYHLILPSDLSKDIEKGLAKTALLSRIRLAEEDAFTIYGFLYQNPEDLLPPLLHPLPTEKFGFKAEAGAAVYYLGDCSYIFILKKEKASFFTKGFEEKEQLKSALAWHLSQLKAKRIEIYPQSKAVFLPHRLDLHLSGHLNFQKGCYKGQEIIARMHYKAKLKHGLACFTLDFHKEANTPKLYPGQKIFHPENHQEIGELVDYCPQAEKTFLVLASLLIEHPSSILLAGRDASVELNFSK